MDWSTSLVIEVSVASLLTLGVTVKYAPRLYKYIAKTKNGNAITQNASVTAEAGASPMTAVGGRDAYAAQEMHIHQSEEADGNRREALRALKKANDGIIWAIDQSKNPRVGNTPEAYLSKLRTAFEIHYAKFTKADLSVLEPLIDTVVDYRKKFSDLEEPVQALKKSIKTLM